MGKIICVGLGPGDPELMSVKADRLLRSARHVAYFRKKGRAGQARRIVEGLLRSDATEHAMEYPVTTEIAFDHRDYNDALAAFYDDWAERLAALVAKDDVVVLCEGDPFLYGSFMHLHQRLQGRVEIEVVPGVTGMSGCWTATGIPMVWGDDVLSVLTATLPAEDLVHHMRAADAIVVMKVGRHLPKVRRALAEAGRLEAAWLVERGTMAGQKVTRLAAAGEEVAPYFAIVLAHGNGRRPVKAPA